MSGPSPSLPSAGERGGEVLTPERLVALDGRGPRYTSYPTVPAWRDGEPAGYREALAAVTGPVSVYVHVPFCREQCWFCGCNQVVSGRQSAADRYLDALESHLRMSPLPGRLAAARVHLGGGTPTWLSVEQLARLFELLARHFALDADGELSVEIDPDVTTPDQLELLARLGLTRLSLGVQSFDERVLTAINRPQDPQRIRDLMAWCHARRLQGSNLDLVYGLPFQTPESLTGTIAEVVALRPDRVALYAYAHVPWVKPHQNRIDASALPDARGRAAQLLHARRLFLEAGYQAVGMDHFSLPDDELAVAARRGVLHRNFMGYTTRAGTALVGLGVSAISELDGWFAQQQSHLGTWYRAVERQDPPLIQRGCRLSDDDRVRRDIIASLMCNMGVRFADVERAHGVAFERDFAAELERCRAHEEAGLIALRPDAIEVTELGRLLVRRVAMEFDGWLRRGDPNQFSQTV